MKKNNYDYIISELLYRSKLSASSYTGPYLEINSDLLFNNQAPFTLNQAVTFTSTVKNIPLGYTVKANTHTMSYPIVVPSDVNSNATLIGTPVTVIFSTVGDTFIVSVTVTLEKALNPDIVITDTFTLTAVGAIYFGNKALNNDFTLTSLSSTAYVTENQKVLLPTSINKYIYFVFPLGATPPLFVRDRNGLVIEITDFTLTVVGNYTYAVLNWSTSLPAYSNWELVYNL